jgi:hypothetical protein
MRPQRRFTPPPFTVTDAPLQASAQKAIAWPVLGRRHLERKRAHDD